MKKKAHKFTQQHAVRMYQALYLIAGGLQRGHIKSKPIITPGAENMAIESLDEIVARALSPERPTVKSTVPTLEQAQ